MATDIEVEFLQESNYIEQEYSEIAIDDAIEAWEFAKLSIDFNKDIDVDLICGIHKRLMQNINKRIAGHIREIPIYVGNSTHYKECLKPELIYDELIKWLKQANVKFLHVPKDDADEAIKRIHVAFEKIHPFEDGNGRVGRILMNLQRLRSCMSINVIKESERFEYYKWFKEGENGKNN
jgi:Fic family protein